MDESIPLCTSCGHYHEQGVKCSICGHVGKSQIFVKMRSKGNQKRLMHLNLLCSGESGLLSVPGSAIMTAESALLFEEFCQFCADHLQQNGNMNEFSSSSSSASVSVSAIQLNAALNTCAVLRKGDALLGLLQFDIIPGSDSNSHLSLQIHRAFVHPSHLHSKICWRLIHYILDLCIGIGAPLSGLSITLPIGSGWIEQRVQQLGFIPTTAALQEGFIVYHYNLNDHVEGLQSILQYVQSRLAAGI